MRVLSETNIELIKELLSYSDKYEISVQFWPNQIALYIAKDGIELKDFGGEFKKTIQSAIYFLKRITKR